ncbi:MAG: hypothetical protein WAV41_03955 [Microgenomates group bacterium]
MKVHIASLHYASLENTHPIPAVTIKKIDIPTARTFRFGQGQILHIGRDPFTISAQVIVDDELVRREASGTPLDIYQMTFHTRDPKKVKVVSIFP